MRKKTHTFHGAEKTHKIGNKSERKTDTVYICPLALGVVDNLFTLFTGRSKERFLLACDNCNYLWGILFHFNVQSFCNELL